MPYLQDNLYMMMLMSGVIGVVRLIGAIGLLRNRMWGLALSTIKCSVTMALIIFMLRRNWGMASCPARLWF